MVLQKFEQVVCPFCKIVSMRIKLRESCHILLFDEGIVEKFRVPVTTSLHIPSACAFHIFDDQFESFEIERSHSVECDIEQDQSPLKEGVGSVSCGKLDKVMVRCALAYLLQPCALCAV
jgi:hypothetical protein